MKQLDEMDIQFFTGAEHQPFLWRGSETAVLLVHGFPGTPAEMRPVAELLHPLGWTTQGILLPGFGPDIPTLAERRMEDWLAVALDALDGLRRDHDKLLIVGNSMGGALTIQMAAQREVDAVVLFAPFWRVNHVLWEVLPALKHVFRTIRPYAIANVDMDDPKFRESMTSMLPTDVDLDDPDVQDAVRNMRVPTSVLDEIRRAGQRANEAAPKLNVPTLVIQGLQDELVAPANTRKLIARFGGDVRYREVNGGHDLTDTRIEDWGVISKTIVEFAQTVAPAVVKQP